MFAFLLKNLGTIAVGAVLLGIVALVVASIVRDKKRGRHIGCDCDCSSCPGACNIK
jgi:hypothetical protein